MMESALVIDFNGDVLYRHVPAGRTSASLPDSRALWDVIWENREKILGIAHSHPGGGVPGPSHTDITTFAAVETALGRRLDWWIASSDALVVCRWCGPDKLDYEVIEHGWKYHWLEELRALGRIDDAAARPTAV